jgi:two-component system CheB/CheR fusion protein
VVENVTNDFELTIEQKKAIIEVQGLPNIKSAPLQMNQLFYNLLNNSLKFSRENVQPVITVKCRILSSEETKQRKNLKTGVSYYDITVADNGIGFDPQYSEHIFEVFKRLQNKAAYPGSGIGLALCRKIALNHHGDIYGEGKEGEGSIFHVILPANQPENANSPKNQ